MPPPPPPPPVSTRDITHDILLGEREALESICLGIYLPLHLTLTGMIIDMIVTNKHIPNSNLALIIITESNFKAVVAGPPLFWSSMFSAVSLILVSVHCTFKGLFRRHDFVSLTQSYMILSCMIFLFRRHYSVMCDFFQQ